jgi:hypothetical protein
MHIDELLKEKREEILRIATRHGARNLKRNIEAILDIFGS